MKKTIICSHTLAACREKKWVDKLWVEGNFFIYMYESEWEKKIISCRSIVKFFHFGVCNRKKNERRKHFCVVEVKREKSVLRFMKFNRFHMSFLFPQPIFASLSLMLLKCVSVSENQHWDIKNNMSDWCYHKTFSHFIVHINTIILPASVLPLATHTEKSETKKLCF